MIARNPEKMREKLDEISKDREVETMMIEADFSTMFQIEDYQEKIADQVRDLDIAMVFLNAGYAQIGAFQDLPFSEIQTQVMVNAFQPVFLAKVLLP